MDWLRYSIEKIKNRKTNNEFKKNYPEIELPPDYLIYESFGINYEKFYTQSIETVRWLTNHIEQHMVLKNKRILDWGCGPGRIIRHLPDVIGNDCEYYGTDYNKKSIEWCAANLPGISFNLNSLNAELPYENNFMDVIYGISILTHLSGQKHYEWYNELYRILKPGGIMFLTSQGNNYRGKLTGSELEKYNNNDLVVRGKVKEGHRTYSAFHPPGFMRKLFNNAEILNHIEPSPEKGKWLPQDIWILRKP